MPNALKTFEENFIHPTQLKVIKDLSRGEEGEYFKSKMNELAQLVDGMPKTYEQDGMGDDAVVYLHYFYGGMDWYITEKDMEDEQYQAFGYVKGQSSELGYVSLVEILGGKYPVELDLYFEPKKLSEVKN